MGRVLVVSDLDDTLVGSRSEDRQALVELNQVLLAPDVTLVYATGRSPASARSLMAEVQLLLPAALVGGVGTTITYREDLDTPDEQWWNHLKPGWDAGVVDKIAELHPQLVLQARGEQSPFKRSYLLAPVHEGLIQQLERECQDAGLDVRLIYSSYRDLDILPVRASKGLAVQYLQQRWGFDNSNTVVFGDSGNDQTLFETGSLGVAVGNARKELAEWLDTRADLPIYRAQGRCAAGMLEGLRHWGLVDD